MNVTMAPMKCILKYYFFIIYFCMVMAKEYKQDKAEKTFSLKCSDGEYVSLFASNFTREGNDRRRYRIQCQKLKYAKESKCSPGKETDLVKYFDDVGCGENEYLGGFESTRYKDGDRRFRLICCRTNDLSISKSNCEEVQTQIQHNFSHHLQDGEIIHKLSSKFSIWQSNNRFLIDRRWRITICKFENSSSLTRGENENENTEKGINENNANSEKNSNLPLNETCKIGISGKGYSVVGPSPDQDSVEPGRNTPAYKWFNVQCPNGHAVRSVRIVAKIDGEKRKDFAFDIRCDPLPFDEDLTVCPVKRREAAFIEDNEAREVSSSQSPCDRIMGEFLCGLSGLYMRDHRKLTAFCCTIKDVFPSNVQPLLADPSAGGFAEVKAPSKYVINLDQLPGAIVGHMATFRTVITQHGRMVSTADGCHCKCPCKCPMDDTTRKHRNNKSSETRRKRAKAECHNTECTCKCWSTCDK